MAWYHRLLNVVRPDALSRDLDTEIASHIAERTDDLVAAGMTRERAAHEARRQFGNTAIQKERTHDVDGMAWLESLIADTRYAMRTLRKSPGFTVVTVLSLALGIGANTAVFSLTNAVVLRSLPVRNPDELVAVIRGSSGTRSSVTNPIWEQIRDDTSAFAGSLAYGATAFNLANGGDVRRATGNWVSGSFFSVLGVRASAGRVLMPSDDTRGCAPIVVLSDGFARREHGSPEAALGRTVSLDGHPFEVVGVADPGFSGLEAGTAPEVYAPICAEAITTGRADILDARSRWSLSILGRTKPGMSAGQLATRLAELAPRVFAATVPGNWDTNGQQRYLRSTLTANPAAAGLSGLRESYGKALFTMMVVVGVVLLIACANIANLLLARAAARQREIAVRLAIGVGRWRLTRQLLTESLPLSLGGAALGALFARWAGQLLVGLLSTRSDPIWLDLSPDLRVLAFTTGLATLTGIAFGLVPAWRASHVDPQVTLKAGGRSVMRSGAARRIGRALVVAQVALSLVLVAGGALLLGSFERLVNLDAGFNRNGVLLAELTFPGTALAGDRLVATQHQLLERIRQARGVTTASASVITPIGHAMWNDIVVAPGFAPARFADSVAYFNQVSDGYFATMGIPLLAGRDVSAEDITGKRSVVVVDETLARRVFGSPAAAVGRTFVTPIGDTTSPPRTVVGVVGGTKYARLDEPAEAVAYFPLGVGDEPGRQLSFEIRANGSTDGSTAGVVTQVRSLAASVNPGITLDFRTLESQVAESLARPRLLATLSGFFGLLALLLAMIGLYGTMAYNVSQRQNEIGIRMALGARSPRVLRMVVGEAARLIGAGIVAGSVLALATTRLLSGFLFGVTAADPATMAFAAALLLLTGLAASFAPAWRAARLDPMTALRDE